MSTIIDARTIVDVGLRPLLLRPFLPHTTDNSPLSFVCSTTVRNVIIIRIAVYHSYHEHPAATRASGDQLLMAKLQQVTDTCK